MKTTYEKLAKENRLLIEVELKPLQGDRFQPTGFPDLGPARYTSPDGTDMLLVESPQSVANRMEIACWDSARHQIIEELAGLPYIAILDRTSHPVSNSILEAHRINSEYIMKNAKRVIRNNGNVETVEKDFHDEFSDEIEYQKDGRVNWDQFQKALFKYDPNSLIHGCFLEEIGGRLRITRALSAFIEAKGIRIAESGGVKHNIVQPDLKGGEGNVPYHRTEFTAEKVLAYFNLDIALLRSYGLPEVAYQLLLSLSLFKIQRFLSTGLRLRTACDLEPFGDFVIKRPKDDFTIPSEESLLSECTALIAQCRQAGLFANPAVTEVLWKK
jgi:CRISPR-associated protein Csb1